MLTGEGSDTRSRRSLPHLADQISQSLLPSLRSYRRVFLRDDILAALTLLAIAVPEQLATSRLAGMPPITGFYAFVAGAVGFALLGTSRQLSVGADSTIAPLFLAGVSSLATVGSARYIALVGVLALIVGALVVLVGVLRIGWIADFLSTPIIDGFLAGVAVIIVVHQLPDLLGIAHPTGSMLHRLVFVGEHAGASRIPALFLGLSVLVFVFVCERLNRRLPAALVGLVLATAVVAIAKLRPHGVAVLGRVAASSPHLSLTGVSWSDLGHVTALAVVVALVVISQTTATAAAFSAGEPSGDINRTFSGVGAANVLAGLVGAFPVNASPPRTAAVASAGGKTQLTSLLAAAAILCLIPAAFLLDDVPLAALAGILIWVASRIVHGRDLAAIARFSRFELVLAVVCALSVAFVGVEQGIAVAVALAVFDRARRGARPQIHVLGRIPGTTSFAPVGGTEAVELEPGVLVVLFAVPLWYANAFHFRDSIHRLISQADPPRTVVLDAIGMSDIDYTGTIALRAVLDELERRQILLVMARTGHTLRSGLERGGLLERIGASSFFSSVGEAVESVEPSRALR